MSNMRVVYDNAANRATLTASTTAGSLVVGGLLTDIKSEVWRSTAPTAQLSVTWATAEFIGMVALPFCSLSSASLIRVRCYTYAADTVPMLDTGFKPAAAVSTPFDSMNWGTEPIGVNAYSYGGGTYGAIWFAIGAFQKLLIDIDDFSNPVGYIEAARLVTGTYWEVVNNAEFGVDLGVGETSTHQRTDAGDLRTDRGAMYKTMNLNLSIMPVSDRNNMWRVMRGNGMSRPIYLSLVPNAVDSFEEQAFQIYGKLSKQSSIRYQFVNQFASQIEIEEI